MSDHYDHDREERIADITRLLKSATPKYRKHTPFAVFDIGRNLKAGRDISINVHVNHGPSLLGWLKALYQKR